MADVQKHEVERETRLDHALRQAGDFSVKEAKRMIHNGMLKVNGHVVKKPAFKVRKGDQLVYVLDQSDLKPKASKPKKTIDLDVIYEDEFMIAVNKPPGLLSVPKTSGRERSLQDALLSYLSDKTLAEFSQKPQCFAVHRLDRDASGVLLFAKNKDAQEQLMTQFKARKVVKTYWAIIHLPTSSALDVEGEINVAIDDNRPKAKAIAHAGKPAKTTYQILQREGDLALVEARTKTGRRHQVRIHMKEALGPILGDQLYNEDQSCREAYPHLALHGKTVELKHPKTHQHLKLEAMVPRTFNLNNFS